MITDKKYAAFLKAKVKMAPELGLPCEAGAVNPTLKPHQAAVVQWMVQGGRRACFAAFGLGKSIIQLEAVRLVLEKTGGRGLIVIPLGVRQEFRRDAVELLGWKEAPKFIRTIEEAGETGIYLTNYETVRDGKLDPCSFQVASLDEASVLRGFGGSKTFREFMRLFTGDAGPAAQMRGVKDRVQTVPYRFVATATPSPNEYIELLAYADFLGIMDVSQAKTRFFKRDSTKADKLTIHPHKEREFWLWVASWAIFVQKPSDLGFDDTGYALPEMTVHWHEVATDHHNAGHERNGQAKMFRNSAIGVQDASAEKRSSLPMRINKVIELIHDQRREERALQGVVSSESGGAFGEAANQERRELPKQPGEISGAKPAVEAQQPGEVFGTVAEERREESSTKQDQKPGVVSREQATSLRKGPRNKAPSLRPNDSAISGDARGAGREVRDLPNTEGQIARRPLPPIREDEETTLPQVQCRAGDVHGQPGASESGRGLSEQLVIWCDLNDEQQAVERALADEGVSFSSIYGPMDIDEKERLLAEWKARKTTAFISKAKMHGAGVNLQQCHRMIFIGITYKAYELIQAIHRIVRFLQTEPCQIHIIFTEAEREVRKQLERKWTQHNHMVKEMGKIIAEFGLSHSAMAQSLTRKLGVERVEINGDGYRLVNNDCVEETRRLEKDSVGLVLTSIPFSTQYEYSPNFADFGHSEGNEQFFKQMDFLTPELLRVLMPGRIAAIHVKDRIVPGGMTGLGFQVVYPFHARCIEHYTKHGFAYMGMKTIVTDVVRENNQTYRLGWTEQCKDGSKMGVGMPEYLLLFRKPPTDASNSYADNPVTKRKSRYTRSRWQIDAHGFTRSSGDRPLTPEELVNLPHDAIYNIFKQYNLESVYDFEHHVKIGEALETKGMLPVTFMLLQPQSWHDDVWTDITRMLTLNGAQSAKGKEMHLCPMQFDLADRVIEQMSNEGDTVLDPFGGLMTVPFRAIKQRRKAIAFELSAPYFIDGAQYCKAAAEEMAMPSLFDATEFKAKETPKRKAALA